MSLPSVRRAIFGATARRSAIPRTPSRFIASTPPNPPPSSSSAPPPPTPVADPTSHSALAARKTPVGVPEGGPARPTKPIMSPQAMRDRERQGLFNFKTAAIFLTAGTGLYYYFETEKAKMDEIKRKQAAQKSIKTGKPLIGGPFSLLDQNGKEFTEKNLLGQWTLMYFGFTNCPDICPEELDKMSDVVDILDKKHGPIARPIFVSCDPARDDIPQVKKYVAEFHPRTIGLTGPYEAVKHMCKVYRVYFSTPPKAKATDDYLVDHSIYFYLLDPDGAFVEAFGKDVEATAVAEKVEGFLEEWKEHARLAARLG